MGACIMISVIIPAYNAENTILRALESLKKQTRLDLITEIIIVNDGSTDQTEELINSFKSKNSQMNILVINQANSGVSVARNKGLHESKSEWVALLDSDDEWLPNKIEIQWDYINKNSNIDFIGGNHIELPLVILGKKVTTLYRPSIKDLCIKVFPQTSTVLFKRQIFEEIGGFDISRSYCEDAQYFYKIALNYGYYYIPEQLSIYDGGKQGFGSSGLSANIKEMNNGMKMNYFELYEQKHIKLSFFLFILVFNELKYWRRILLARLAK